MIAAEKGVVKRAHEKKSDLYKFVQKIALYFGLTKNYTPDTDDGEQLPSESSVAQRNLRADLKEFMLTSKSLMDLQLTKDTANQSAVADLIVDGQLWVKDVPVTSLLSWEKAIVDMISFLKAMPTLPRSQVWTKDEASGQYITEAVRTSRTKKQQKPIVLYDATDKHPAQTQIITEDVKVGTWTKQDYSTAMPEAEKEMRIEKASRLLDDVKRARERANDRVIEQREVPAVMLDYLLG